MVFHLTAFNVGYPSSMQVLGVTDPIFGSAGRHRDERAGSVWSFHRTSTGQIIGIRLW